MDTDPMRDGRHQEAIAGMLGVPLPEPDVDPGRTLLSLALRDEDDDDREEVILRWLDILPVPVALRLTMRVKRLSQRLKRLAVLLESRLIAAEFGASGGYVDREAQVAYGMESDREWHVDDPEGMRAELFKAGLPVRVLDKAVPMVAAPNHAVLNTLVNDPVIPADVRRTVQSVLREYRRRKYGPPHLVAYPMGEHHDADTTDESDQTQ